jgi:hypothetical protein
MRRGLHAIGCRPRTVGHMAATTAPSPDPDPDPDVAVHGTLYVIGRTQRAYAVYAATHPRARWEMLRRMWPAPRHGHLPVVRLDTGDLLGDVDAITGL